MTIKLTQNFVNEIIELVTLPEVYHRIRALIITPDAKIEEYAQIIDTDPALAARIVEISNTNFFGYSRTTDSVEDAISLIGIMQLHDLLLSSLAIRAFSGIPDKIINLNDFWRSCVFCGIAARLLAYRSRVPAGHRLFTTGLLHEIGHIVMYAKTPQRAQAIFMDSEQFSKPIFLLERERLGFDYAQLGRELMRLWDLPESYQEITEFHLEPEKATRYQVDTAIVHIAHQMSIAEECNERRLTIAPIALKITRLQQKVISEVQLEARQYVEEVMDSLWPSARNAWQDCVILL